MESNQTSFLKRLGMRFEMIIMVIFAVGWVGFYVVMGSYILINDYAELFNTTLGYVTLIGLAFSPSIAKMGIKSLRGLISRQPEKYYEG